MAHLSFLPPSATNQPTLQVSIFDKETKPKLFYIWHDSIQSGEAQQGTAREMEIEQEREKTKNRIY